MNRGFIWLATVAFGSAAGVAIGITVAHAAL